MQCAIKTTAELVVRNDPVASRVERMTESPEVQPLVCGWLVSPVMVTSIDPVPPPVIEMPHRAPCPGLSICPLITALEALLSLMFRVGHLEVSFGRPVHRLKVRTHTFTFSL